MSAGPMIPHFVPEVLMIGLPTVAASRATSADPVVIRSRSLLGYGPLSYGPSKNRDLLSHAQLHLRMT